LRELSKIIDETEKKTLQGKITDYYKGRINEQMFFDSWLEILGKRLVSLTTDFYILNNR